MELGSKIESRRQILQNLREKVASKSPLPRLTDAEIAEREKESRKLTYRYLEGVGFKFELNKEGDRIKRILEVPPEYNYGPQKQSRHKEKNVKQVDLSKIDTDRFLDSIMEELNPQRAGGEGIKIGKGWKELNEWRAGHPRRRRRTKGDLLKRYG